MDFHKKTLLKVNLLTTVVAQSGNEFMCNDIKHGTSRRINNREVGACYARSNLDFTYATEFHIENENQLFELVSKFDNLKSTTRNDLLSKPSGIRKDNGSENTIGELLKLVTETNLMFKNKRSSRRFKLSPYSIMTKVTIQHFVPKDLKDTMKYPERYTENTVDYSSNLQVYELRIPLVPSLDSELAIAEIFSSCKRYIDSLNPNHRFEKARSTRLSLKSLIGNERYELLTKQEPIIDIYKRASNFNYTNTNDGVSHEGGSNVDWDGILSQNPFIPIDSLSDSSDNDDLDIGELDTNNNKDISNDINDTNIKPTSMKNAIFGGIDTNPDKD